MVGVTLGSGRDKHRLEMTRGEGSVEGRLQGAKVLGASAATPGGRRSLREFKVEGLQRSAHSRVVQ